MSLMAGLQQLCGRDDLQALNSKPVLSKASFLQDSFQEQLYHVLESLNSDSLCFCYSKTIYILYIIYIYTIYILSIYYIFRSLGFFSVIIHVVV